MVCDYVKVAGAEEAVNAPTPPLLPSSSVPFSSNMTVASWIITTERWPASCQTIKMNNNETPDFSWYPMWWEHIYFWIDLHIKISEPFHSTDELLQQPGYLSLYFLHFYLHLLTFLSLLIHGSSLIQHLHLNRQHQTWLWISIVDIKSFLYSTLICRCWNWKSIGSLDYCSWTRLGHHFETLTLF